MDLNAVLGRAVELGASDIHLKVGQPPVLRRDGELGLLPDHPPLYDSDLEAALAIVADMTPAKLSHFHESGELDIAYSAEGLPRFRVNGYRQRGSISFAFRCACRWACSAWPRSIVASCSSPARPARARRPRSRR